MSRTGTYWSDHNDRLNCAHGVILHGTRCVQCERGDLPGDPSTPRSFLADAVRAAMAGKFSDGGFVPRSMRATGFDTASGPDRTVEITMSVDDIKPGYEWREEVRRRTEDTINGNRERMEALHERINEALRNAAGGRDYYRMPDPPYDFGENVYSARDAARKRWEHRGDPRPREHHYCRSTINAVWGDGTPLTDDEADLINGRYRGAEIITDPLDQRGVNARRVGPGL